MLNVLFATDFGKEAPGMFRYTTMLAEKLGLKVIMFHAFGTGELLNAKEVNDRGASVLKRLKEFVNSYLPDDSELEFEYLVDEGFAFDAIPKVATDEGIDIVVMGMKHGGYSLDAIIGNTTLDTLLSIECGVLVFPEGFKTENIKQLGCTTDFKFKDIALINLLRDLGESFGKGTAIYCLHVFEKDEDEERVRKDMEVLHRIFDNKKGVPVHLSIQSGALTDTIEKYALENELDLMVMNAHQRNTISKFLGNSTTKEVAKDIQVPLLILKDL